MKLYLNKTSPYARLVMVVAHEKALADRIECVFTDPWASPAALVAVNPYAKVPALVTDEGDAIVESACICDYLDDAGGGRRLVPREAAARLPVLRKHGLGRGLIDVGFGVTIERRFGGAGGDGELAQRWLAAARRAVEVLEREPALGHAGEAPDLGDLAIAVGLAYTEFRVPEVGWRGRAPRLAQWFDRVAARPAMQHTAPA